MVDTEQSYFIEKRTSVSGIQILDSRKLVENVCYPTIPKNSWNKRFRHWNQEYFLVFRITEILPWNYPNKRCEKFQLHMNC